MMKIEELNDEYLLALCIDREAESEPDEGKIAVGSVILNRVDFGKHRPAWGRIYGDSIKKVILAPSQFSWTLPGKNRRIACRYAADFQQAMEDNKALARCYEIAQGLMNGSIPRNVSGRFYHRFDCHPRWAKAMTIERQIGDHVFYQETAAYIHMENKDWILSVRGIAERLRSLCLIMPHNHLFFDILEDSLDNLDSGIETMIERDKLQKQGK